MIDPRRHIEKARRALAGGHVLLKAEFIDQAGRQAYLAAFHAALAYIGSQTGKEPKTHSGARTEFARLMQTEHRIPAAYVAFLGRAYEYKTYADYDGDEPVSLQSAVNALSMATEMVDLIEGILP